MKQQLRFYPDIDYRVHPAFRDLGVPARDDDSVVDGMIANIDRDLEALHATRYHAAALREAFDSGPGCRIAELAAYLDRTTSNERVRRLLSRAFKDVTAELLYEARIRNDRHEFNRMLSPQARRVADDLKRDGAHICRLTGAERQKLWELCAPAVARLRAAAALNPKTRVAESMPRYSGVGVRLEKFFRRSGALDGLSAYFGSNVTFTGFSLEYSHNKQDWWQNCYADVGLATSKTVYMHYDHGCRNPKAIVALSNVTEENGPTGYIKGSNTKPRSNFIHFLIKSIDLRFYDDYVAGTRSYYRRRFQEVEYRREFLMLPTALQACSHFGEDITDDTDLSADLLKDEIKLTHDVGNCVVFDGDYGIHRGALAESGERFVFQVIFAVEPEIPKIKALQQRARAIARRLLKGE
ncbi:hypothetical protein [Methylocystis sp. B8]|uniref:hypothetical protein n=1 Tax=Methylocystis sp. B8 TaxID=544938 RepID=UPI0010FDB753|nr:hypothetical protein [Methylocystis sp. B8]TLG77616.1 hypothetical protein FEV16_07225 [Methylocystis sp. B8]